jgi:Zn-dependent protease
VELINETFLGEPLRLEANMAGWQQLYWNGQLVAGRNASADTPEQIRHEFELQSNQGSIHCQLDLNLSWMPFKFDYTLSANGQTVQQGTTDAADLGGKTPDQEIPMRPQFSIIGLASLGLKLLKSAKAIKVLLVGASVAAYSWLFSFQFALLLIGCLVIHEYGHIRAMKRFGMKTKGIYLIPFVGGLAVGENKLNTRWQNVVISIMGPVYGLFLSVGSLALFYITGNPLFAGLAGFNALLNLFNLLPILPLDGGHILKSIAFSMHSVVGLVLCIGGALLGVGLSYAFGLALLGLLLLIGSLEIVFEWRMRHHSTLLPLDRYGQIVSVLWYLLVVGAFIAIIYLLASTGDQILGLPLEVLKS